MYSLAPAISIAGLITMSTRYAIAAVEHLARRHFLASRKGAGDATPFEQIRQQNIFEVLEYLSWKHVWDGNDEPIEVRGLLPVRVYLPEEDAQAQDSIATAINDLTAAFGLEIAFEFREVRGVWLKTWFMNVREAPAIADVAERLRRTGRGAAGRGFAGGAAARGERPAQGAAIDTQRFHSDRTAAHCQTTRG
jgi:hypothetical protein